MSKEEILRGSEKLTFVPKGYGIGKAWYYQWRKRFHSMLKTKPKETKE